MYQVSHRGGGAPGTINKKDEDEDGAGAERWRHCKHEAGKPYRRKLGVPNLEASVTHSLTALPS